MSKKLNSMSTKCKPNLSNDNVSKSCTINYRSTYLFDSLKIIGFLIVPPKRNFLSSNYLSFFDLAGGKISFYNEGFKQKDSNTFCVVDSISFVVF